MNGILLGWLLGDGTAICAECDDWFEHEDWTPIYQGDAEAEMDCAECGCEL